MIRTTFGLLAWVLFCVSDRIAKCDSGPDTETLANKALDSSIVSLIREAMASPKAEIDVQMRSKWHIDYFEKQSTRWWSVIGFHFKVYSSEAGQKLSGFAITVFVYDPAKAKTVIMTPDTAAVAIKRGRVLNAVPEPTPPPSSTVDKDAI